MERGTGGRKEECERESEKRGRRRKRMKMENRRRREQLEGGGRGDQWAKEQRDGGQGKKKTKR